MSRSDRWRHILGVIASGQEVEVDSLASDLGASPATIRRDLNALAAQGMMVRTRGGAVSASISYDLPIRYKSVQNAEQKLAIAAAVARIIPPGSVVGINGGTTSTEVARALATETEREQTPSPHSLTIVTNAVNIANELVVRPAVKTVLTGGVARSASYELVGALAAVTLKQIALDVAVIGVGGIDAAEGATASHEEEAAINRLMAERARRVIVVADSTKVGRTAFAQICRTGVINTLVTDRGADTDALLKLRRAGVEVVEVG